MKHLELVKPVALEDWEAVLRGMDSDTSFRDHARTFGVEQALRITAELKEIVDDFGDAALGAVFAERKGVIVGLWIDSLHNYTAIEFSRETGDEDDVVLTLSFMQRRD